MHRRGCGKLEKCKVTVSDPQPGLGAEGWRRPFRAAGNTDMWPAASQA